MPKYLCELSLLTRSTALVIVESDHQPNRGNLREAYAGYEDDEWQEDPEYAEEGQHGMLGLIEGDTFPGVKNLAELPVFKINDDYAWYVKADATVIANADDLADHLGTERNEKSIARRVYKDTSCGAWFKISDDAEAVEIGSIVEGVDGAEAGPEVLVFPFTVTEYDAAIQSVEDDVSVIWNATHGCEQCGPEDASGYRHVNPECPACKGEGTVI